MVGSSIFSGCQLKNRDSLSSRSSLLFLRFLSAAFPPPIRLVVIAQPTIKLCNRLSPTQPTASRPCSFGRLCNLYHLLNKYSCMSLNALCICSTLFPLSACPSNAKLARSNMFILFSCSSRRPLSRSNSFIYLSFCCS